MHFELTIEDVEPNRQIYICATPHIYLELVLKGALRCCMRVVNGS
jgi:hypothetical protein